MTLQAAIGFAQALDGREAGLQAAHQALNHLGVGSPGLASSFHRMNINRARCSAVLPVYWAKCR